MELNLKTEKLARVLVLALFAAAGNSCIAADSKQFVVASSVAEAVLFDSY